MPRFLIIHRPSRFNILQPAANHSSERQFAQELIVGAVLGLLLENRDHLLLRICA